MYLQNYNYQGVNPYLLHTALPCNIAPSRTGWDGLALIHRGETSFVNEPYITGGNPILSSKDGVMFNDMLGNTLATKNDSLTKINMTAFGETDNKDAMFTGKPMIGELGYAFLFRNYRADQGKWQTSDPLGYPDGWNNFAYVNNGVTAQLDPNGLDSFGLQISLSGVAGGGPSAGGGFTFDSDTGDVYYSGSQSGNTGLNIGVSVTGLYSTEGTSSGTSTNFSVQGGACYGTATIYFPIEGGYPTYEAGLSVGTDIVGSGSVGAGVVTNTQLFKFYNLLDLVKDLFVESPSSFFITPLNPFLLPLFNPYFPWEILE